MTGRKGTFFYILCAVLSGASLVGCGGGENTEEVFVVEKEENEVEYSMAAVTVEVAAFRIKNTHVLPDIIFDSL